MVVFECTDQIISGLLFEKFLAFVFELLGDKVPITFGFPLFHCNYFKQPIRPF